MLTENELIKFRRELHSYPETGWCEFVTTHKIVEKLRSFGLDPIYGRQVINPEFVAGRNPAKVEEAKKAALDKGVPPEFIESMQDYTGVAAIFETGRPGPVLAIRFDMDCVDVDEAHEAGHRPFDEGWAYALLRPRRPYNDGYRCLQLDSGKPGSVLRNHQSRLPAR